jgi:hypothetical protein
MPGRQPGPPVTVQGVTLPRRWVGARRTTGPGPAPRNPPERSLSPARSSRCPFRTPSSTRSTTMSGGAHRNPFDRTDVVWKNSVERSSDDRAWLRPANQLPHRTHDLTEHDHIHGEGCGPPGPSPTTITWTTCTTRALARAPRRRTRPGPMTDQPRIRQPTDSGPRGASDHLAGGEIGLRRQVSRGSRASTSVIHRSRSTACRLATIPASSLPADFPGCALARIDTTSHRPEGTGPELPRVTSDGSMSRSSAGRSGSSIRASNDRPAASPTS